jgi:hypothetical protein
MSTEHQAGTVPTGRLVSHKSRPTSTCKWQTHVAYSCLYFTGALLLLVCDGRRGSLPSSGYELI